MSLFLRRFTTPQKVSLGLVLFLALVIGARATINYATVLRLTPLSVTVVPESDLPSEVQALETQTVSAAFDRDTTTIYTAYGRSQVTAAFEGVEEIHRLRVFGPSPYRASLYAVDARGNSSTVSGWTNLDLSSLGPGWNNFDLPNPVNSQTLVIALSPTTVLSPSSAAQAGLAEMEFWGKGMAQNETDASGWDALLNSTNGPSSLLVSGREYPSNAPVTDSTPVTIGGPNEPSTVTFTVNLPMGGQSYRKAWLMYDVNGLSSWIAVPRMINGLSPGGEAAGGWPLPGSAQWTTQVEEIHPLWLSQGSNSFSFILPSGVVNPYEIRNLKVVAEEDDGANLIDEVDSSSGNASVLLDGDETTGWRPYVDGEGGSNPNPSLTFNLYRTQQLDSIELYLPQALPGQVVESVEQQGTWKRLGDVTNGQGLGSGWQGLPVSATGPVDAFRLEFRGGDGSSSAIMEAVAMGSGVGKPYGPTVEVTYPDQGQFFGTEAYIRGFLGQADDGSGAAQVFLGAQPAQVMNGQFEGIVGMDQVGAPAGSTSWAVTVTAVYPDGVQLAKVVELGTQEGGGTGAGQGTFAQMMNPGEATVLNQLGAKLSVGANALTSKVNLQMVPLNTTDLEPLNPGMTNVTGGTYRGYRFLPHGTIFNSQVKISVPYDPTMLPSGKTAADVRTFYFDTNRGMWEPLPLSSLDTSGQMVNSLTTHFTDFINATITVPDSPLESSFNPTQMSGIQAADPGTGLNLIAPPEVNNQGTADLSYPIEIPPGRHGLEPGLEVQYNSAGGNSWMGLGWDLKVPEITVETRWGAPRYSGSGETEDYLLNGQQLVMLPPNAPGVSTYLAHRMSGVGSGGSNPVTFIGRQSSPVTFMTRMEGDFDRIIRYGAGPSAYTWEVDEKDGMRSFYGGKPGAVQAGTPENGTSDPAVLTDNTSSNAGNIFVWALRETKDPYGNCVVYHYDYAPTTLGHDFYPGRIAYTGTNDQDGPYQVKFFHGEGEYAAGGGTTLINRQDNQIYAKGGFTRTTFDVLDHLDVTLNGSLVRRYAFTYQNGAFSKTLLNSIQQFGSAGEPFPGNTHSFTYFNDLDPLGSGTDAGFAPATAFTSPSLYEGNPDSISPAVGMSSPLLPINALDTSETDGGSGHIYVGIAPPFDEDKFLSAGVKVGLGGSNTSEKLSLIDVDGDGLPDLVYQGTDGAYYYLKNESASGPLSFSSTPQPLPTLNGISQDSAFNLTLGAESYLGANLFYDFTTQWSTQSVFFEDVNGDGIPDLVYNGQVYFGSVDSNGNVSYSMSSGLTPNPLGASQAIYIPPDLSMVVTEAAKDPLVDTLKQWTAPYDGVITITAPVTLLTPPAPTGTVSATPSVTPDGVRALIEHASGMPSTVANQALAGVTISEAQAGVGQALSASVTVSRGDRIYFRLQSVFDGRDDTVAWNPLVQYQQFTDTGATVSGAVSDENGLDAATYQPSNDFTVAGLRGVTITMPLSGTVSIGGAFCKLGPTTDDLSVYILQTTYSGVTILPGPVTQGVTIISEAQTIAAESAATTLWSQTVSANQSVTLPLALSGVTVNHIAQQAVTNSNCTQMSAVTQVDQLELYVKSDTNIDLSQIRWQPTLYYTALAPPTPNPCTGVTPQAVTANFPVIPLAYQEDFYPELTESPVDGAPQAPLTVAAPAVTLSTPPSPPATPTPTSTPTGTLTSTATPAASVTPAFTAIPPGEGVLYMNGILQVNAAPGSAVTLEALVNGTPVFTQTVTPGVTPGAVTIQGELSGLVKAGDQLLLTYGAATTTDLGNLPWSPSLYYVNPFSNDAALTGTGAVTYTPDYAVALGGAPATLAHYVMVPRVLEQSQYFGGYPLEPSVLASAPHGNLTFSIKQPPNRAYKSTVDISSANWGAPVTAGSFFSANFLAVTFSTGVTVAPVQVAPVTLLEGFGQLLYFNFTASDESGRTNLVSASLSSGSLPSVPFSFDTPGNYPEEFGGGGVPVSLLVTTFGPPFNSSVTTAPFNNLSPPVTMTLPVAYRGWAYCGLENDPAQQGVPVTGAGNGIESGNPFAEINLEVPAFTSGTTIIVTPQPTPTGTTTSPPMAPITVIEPQSMDGVLFYPGAVTLVGSGGTTSIFQAWNGPSTEIYAAAGTVGSSRLLKDALFIPAATSGTTVSGGSLAGVPARSSIQLSGTLGFGGDFLSGSYTLPNGSATCQQDYLDMNGDGYPDILVGSSVTYTNPTGNFSSATTNLPMNLIRTSSNLAGNFGVGGNPADPDLAADGRDMAGGYTRPRSNAVAGGKGGAAGEGGGKSSMQPLGSIGLAFGSSYQNVDLIDMNGDGLPDQVTTDGAGHLLVYLNTGYGFSTTPVTWGNAGGTSITSVNQSSSMGINGGVGFNDGIYGFAGGASAEADFSSSEFEFVDINGDGLPDLVWDNVTGLPQGSWLVQFNTGSGFAAPVTWTGAYVPLSLPDGLNTVESTLGNLPLPISPLFPPTTDLETNFNFNIGGGVYATIGIPIPLICTIIINPGADFQASASEQWVKLIDLTGAGYPSQVVSTSDGSLTLYQNQTGRTNMLRSVSRPMGSSFDLDYANGANTYGDPSGRWTLAQVALYDGGANGNAAKGGADWQITQYSYGGGATAVGAVAVTSGGYYDRYDREFAGYSAVTETQLDTRGYNSNSAPATTQAFPAYRQTVLQYLNSNLFEKGLVSEETLEDVSGTNPVTFQDLKTQYQLWDVMAQAPVALQAAGLSLSNSILFPQRLETDKSYLEPGSSAAVTTYETYAYDGFGCVTLYVDGGDSPSDAVTENINYTGASFSPALYLVGLPTTLTANGAGGMLRLSEASYDPSTGAVTEVQRIDPTGGTTAVDSMAYDGFGNLSSETGPANLGNDRYERTYQYDTVVQTYPVFTKDSFNYTSTESYDYRFGRPSVDVDENNNRIQWSYDDFGRTVTVIGPMETASGHFTLAFDYHPDALVPYAHTAHFDPFRGENATLDTGCFTDGLGRRIQVSMTSSLFQGTSLKSQDETVVSGRLVFDQAGRVAQQYYPLAEAGTSSAPNTIFNALYDTSASPATLLYDAMNRAVTTFYPDGTSDSSSYAVASNGLQNLLLTTFTDQDGNRQQSYRDVRGLTEQRVEYASPGQAVTTRYQYDPTRELTRITDAGGNVTSITYDLLGRRTAVQSPDAGKTSFTYDPASNLTQKVTANLAKETKAVSYGYSFNRLQTVSYPDFPRNNVTYNYGNPGAALNQAGRIASVKDAAGTLTLAYDALGDAVTQTRVVLVPSGGQWPGESAWDQGAVTTTPVTYTTGFLWDDWGRIQQLTYPDGEVLTYQYDAGGRPRAVAGLLPASGSGSGSGGTLFPYVTRLEYDRFGSRVFRQNGNGTQSAYSYRPDNRRLLTLSSLAGGVTFQGLNYTYDGAGNIKALVNSARSGEGGLAGPVTQGFQYDGLYRLTQASGLYSGAFNTTTGQGFSSRYSLALSYDNLHNITQKNQSVQEQVQGQGFQPDTGLTYDWTYQYKAAQPHAPSLIGTRSFTYDADGNQSGFTDLAGTSRSNVWDEENRLLAVEDGAGAISDGGIRFTYGADGMRVLKVDDSSKITVYPNQFFTALNPLAGVNAQADKHVFIGNDRVATHLVSAPVSTGSNAGNPSAIAQWIGSWGVSIAAGDTDAVNFGSPGNFVTVQRDNVQVLGAPQIWTKGVAILGTANSCQVLTLLNPKPQGGYFEVSFNNQPGYLPVNAAVVGIPTACLQSIASQTTSILPKNSFVFFYHDDQLGSTGYLTDQNGTLGEHIEYLPFGETWTDQSRGTQVFPDYQFTGQELDPETGLYDYGDRYYDPRTSLWQSADPGLGNFLPDPTKEKELSGEGGVFESQNLSLYSYGHDNPLVVTDPDGAAATIEGKAYTADMQRESKNKVVLGRYPAYKNAAYAIEGAAFQLSNDEWNAEEADRNRGNPDRLMTLNRQFVEAAVDANAEILLASDPDTESIRPNGEKTDYYREIEFLKKGGRKNGVEYYYEFQKLGNSEKDKDLKSKGVKGRMVRKWRIVTRPRPRL